MRTLEEHVLGKPQTSFEHMASGTNSGKILSEAPGISSIEENLRIPNSALLQQHRSTCKMGDKVNRVYCRSCLHKTYVRIPKLQSKGIERGAFDEVRNICVPHHHHQSSRPRAWASEQLTIASWGLTGNSLAGSANLQSPRQANLHTHLCDSVSAARHFRRASSEA